MSVRSILFRLFLRNSLALLAAELSADCMLAVLWWFPLAFAAAGERGRPGFGSRARSASVFEPFCESRRFFFSEWAARNPRLRAEVKQTQNVGGNFF